MNQTIIVPALEPTSSLGHLVKDLRNQGFDRILVVDDGSGPLYASVFDDAEKAGAKVVHHEINHGKGAALCTGISFAREYWPDTPSVITVDADGQHLPEDVARVAATSSMCPNALVLGCRTFDDSTPLRSRVGNKVSSLAFRMDTGLTLNDTQTGLRAIPASLFAEALSCPGTHYDWEMNLLTQAVREGRDLRTVPISTVYINNNAGSHFHPIADSARVFASLFRFIGASAICGVLDIALFCLLVGLLGLDASATVLLATVVARLASGAINFALNRSWSFSAEGGDVRVQARRYAMLFFLQMMASAALVTLLSQVVASLLLAKLLADSALFLASYYLQRAWVFTPVHADDFKALPLRSARRA